MYSRREILQNEIKRVTFVHGCFSFASSKTSSNVFFGPMVTVEFNSIATSSSLRLSSNDVTPPLPCSTDFDFFVYGLSFFSLLWSVGFSLCLSGFGYILSHFPCGGCSHGGCNCENCSAVVENQFEPSPTLYKLVGRFLKRLK